MSTLCQCVLALTLPAAALPPPPLPCRQIAVEVDGPPHFSRSRPFRPTGSTAAKRRCLQLRGYSVLSVPFYEWRQLKGEEHPCASSEGGASSSERGGSSASSSHGSGSGGSIRSGRTASSSNVHAAGLNGQHVASAVHAPGGAAGEGADPGGTASYLLQRQIDYLTSALDAAVRTTMPYALRM